MMFKKIVLASAILAATTGVAMADPAPYIGASLGITDNTPNNNNFFSSFRGMPFNVFVGYGGVVTQSYYLAAELTGTVATAEISDGGNNSLKSTYGYGGSIIPGVMLSDHTLAFARAGVVRTRFSNANTFSTGGQAGLGLQTSITQNVDLRSEYDFTAYRSVNQDGFSTPPRSDQFTIGLVYKFD